MVRRYCWALPLLCSFAIAAEPVCTTQTVGSEDFNGISGSSDSYVIAVADSGDIYRNTGGGWTSMTSGTNDDLYDVSVVGPGSAFAVGEDGTVLQLVGNSWISHDSVASRDMFGVWAASATEAYVVGDRGEIYRYNGATWSNQSNAAGTNTRDIEDVWGDANYVYAMSDRGELYIYNRATGSWSSRITTCQINSQSAFRDLWGDNAGNLYLVRQHNVYRYNGSSCPVVATASENLYGIHGSNDGQIYAAGVAGEMLYYDGSSWQASTAASQDINDVWVSGNGTAWHGGNQRQITTCAVPVPNIVGDWHFDDCTLGFNGSTVVDAGPNGLDGTTSGGVDVEANGQLCSAAGMNGSNAYVGIPDGPLTDLTDGIGIAVWIRHNNVAVKDWEAVLAKGDSAYRLHMNGGCEITDTLPGNTRHGITLGLNGGCDGADLNSNVVPSPGVWYHVAATYDRSVMRIYINGSLVNSANYNAAIGNNAYDLFVGENSQQRGRYWNGDIDELTIWDKAISAQQVASHMNRTRPCTSCTAAEFEITHDNYGINCLAETVAVKVVDGLNGTPRVDYNAEVTLDTQTGIGTWTLISGGGTLTDATADDGLATYQWPLGEDTAAFALDYRRGSLAQSSVDIDVYQTNDTGIRDTDAEGNIQFGPDGYTVTSTPLSNPPGAVIPFAATQVAAVGFPVYLTAYGQAANHPECGVIESYTGDKPVQVWFDHVNPVGGSIAPVVGGAAAATSEAAATVRTVTFSNGQATIDARYKDAGQIQLQFKDDSGADPDLPNGIRGATAPFVVKPYRFVLSGIETAGGTPNPGAASAAGPAFMAAGQAFSATVTAVDADGDTTPNYGREINPETVALASTLIAPAGGDNPGINSAAGFGAFVGGQATGNDFSWPEVGIIQLTPSVGDGNYLGGGNVVGATSGNVGRFHPDHFTAVANSPAFSTACAPGGFTYLGQPFNYSTPPVITLTARAADGATTENYAGTFFRLGNATLANRSYTAAAGSLDTSGLPAASVDPAVTAIGNGVGTLTFSSGSGLAFAKTVPQGPFAAEIGLSIDVFDSDGVAALTNPVTVGASGGMFFDAGAEMRWGRIRLLNSIGSELVNLNVPMRAEYYFDAGTGFVASAGDSCTSGIMLALGNYTNNLADGDTCVIDSGNPGLSNIGCGAAGAAGLRYREPPLGGDFNLYLAAPGAGHDGSTTLSADVPAWLRFDWNGASPGFENPAGTATFGIYRGEDRRIYTRELY